MPKGQKRRRQPTCVGSVGPALVENVLQVDYHRNGVTGAPFYAVLFMHDRQLMVGVVFPKWTGDHVIADSCAVLAVDKLSTSDGIKFGKNSWRGDHFEPELVAAINASLQSKRGDA